MSSLPSPQTIPPRGLWHAWNLSIGRPLGAWATSTDSSQHKEAAPQSKQFENFLLSRSSTFSKAGPSQCQMFTSLNLECHGLEYSNSCFVSRFKTFDHVSWRYLIFSLQEFGFGVGHQNIVMLIYNQSKSMETTTGLRSEAFVAEWGTKDLL